MDVPELIILLHGWAPALVFLVLLTIARRAVGLTLVAIIGTLYLLAWGFMLQMVFLGDNPGWQVLQLRAALTKPQGHDAELPTLFLGRPP